MDHRTDSPVSGGDWRDGFVFIANQLGLDFLNTSPVINGITVELLPDTHALSRWLAAADLIPSEKARELSKSWLGRCGEDLAQLQEFRDSLRAAVLELESGLDPGGGFVRLMNELLLRYPLAEQLQYSSAGICWVRRFDPFRPADAFAPIVNQAAELLISANRDRIRKCDSCALHFLDTSKKGTRRWCSMQMCGNKHKVAAYAQRIREGRQGRFSRPRGDVG